MSILKVENVTKRYPGVIALDNVSFEIEPGEIRGLIGENGAGKSTIIKSIAGAIQFDEGKIIVDGKEYTAMNPTLAIQEMRIATPSPHQLVKNLSGGNQQKVVIGKVLATETRIIIFDEPTRGIDVAAKQEIYRLMNDLTKQGISILMISSDMEELLGMSDRIVVMNEGAVAGELTKDQFSQVAVMELASSN